MNAQRNVQAIKKNRVPDWHQELLKIRFPKTPDMLFPTRFNFVRDTDDEMFQ